MQFHRDNSAGINIIRAFGTDGVRIDDRLFALPCVISISTIIEDWSVSAVADIDTSHLEPVIGLEPELIILGTGEIHRFPSAQVAAAINHHGIGFEVMDSAAGCRTYNLLAHEGRNVALALAAG